MEKNFTELHVGGVYLRRDGGIDWIVKDDGSKFPYDSKNDYFYLKNGDYREFQEHDEDLVQYICEYSDIKRLPEIMAENERLKAEIELARETINNCQDWGVDLVHKNKELKAEIEQLKTELQTL